MTTTRDPGIVVYGATGYTGKLVAQYLHKQYGDSNDISWALAGRSLEKLEAVRDELNLPSDLALIRADASEPDTIEKMVNDAKVILTTVGPYQLYGSDLVGACAAAGTHYVDLCGEPAWMKSMIEQHHATAVQSGARIVFSCGFDSIPFDLGVLFLQNAAQASLGTTLPRVRGRVRGMNGSWSGGTLASFKATMAAAAKDPTLLEALTNPFALTPGFNGVEQPGGMKPMFDEVIDSWVAPFVMATINTKNIHRSNALMNHVYGEGFVYDEMLMTGPGEQGKAIAEAVAKDKSMASDPMQPGEGPTKEQRENGNYDILFVGESEDHQTLYASVQGDMDPGYGSTSKMISESAICLLESDGSAAGGISTPAAALGTQLIDRLQKNAGLTFGLETP